MSGTSISFEHEKKSIFYINFILIFFVIVTFFFGFPLKYFFYFNILFTFFLSYFFFKKSRKLSKLLILTNLFIFFYFLYPNVATFFVEIFGSISYLFILLYNLFLAYIFLVFSGENQTFLGDFRKTSFKLLGIVLLVGIVMGFMFYLIREPIPYQLFNPSSSDYFLKILSLTLLLSFSEQMIFTGFLFNSYKYLSSKIEAFYQVAIVFVLFHILRFENLVKVYHASFPDSYLVYITFYYIFLFFFMVSALYFYSLKSKKYTGNFLYPFLLHFFVDTTLYSLVWLFGI